MSPSLPALVPVPLTHPRVLPIPAAAGRWCGGAGPARGSAEASPVPVATTRTNPRLSQAIRDTASPGGDPRTDSAYDAAGQLTAAGAASYSYDPAGNRTMTGYATAAGN